MLLLPGTSPDACRAPTGVGGGRGATRAEHIIRRELSVPDQPVSRYFSTLGLSLFLFNSHPQFHGHSPRFTGRYAVWIRTPSEHRSSLKPATSNPTAHARGKTANPEHELPPFLVASSIYALEQSKE